MGYRSGRESGQQQNHSDGLVGVALGTGFSGHLSIVPLQEVLTKLHVAGETGRLCLFTPMARATVWLSAGNVVEAEIGERSGEAALDVLSILSDGTFTFFAEACAREGTVIPAQVVAKNWESKAARVDALMKELPSLIDALSWEQRALDALAAENPQHGRLLKAIPVGGTLLEALISVDVELVSALELFLQASQSQKKQNDKTSSPMAEPRAALGSHTFVQGSGAPLTEPSARAVAGVRPRRTVLSASERVSASPGQRPQPQLAAKPATDLGRTLVGLPATVLPSEPSEVTGPAAKAPTELKTRGRRFSARPQPPAGTPLDALEVGDVLELVPETVRHSAHPTHAHTSEPPGDAPPPSSFDGNTVHLGGRRLARLSVLSDAGRYAVQLVSVASGSDGSEMALKMPRRPDEAAYAALRAEAAILGSVSHPNLVRLAQSGVDIDMPFLLTWYWPGTTLAELAALDRPLPLGLVVCIVRQVLNAASALHDSSKPGGGVVHCNLCPDNILVGLDGVVRVCGLSSARRFKAKDNDEDLSVHAQYAAPELLRGQRVDERADVYSAGALLGLAWRVAVPDSPQLAQVRAVWGRATASVAAQRYASVREFAAALERVPGAWESGEVADWLAQETAKLKLEVARSAMPPRVAGRMTRRQLAIGRGILVILLVAVALAWALKR